MFRHHNRRTASEPKQALVAILIAADRHGLNKHVVRETRKPAKAPSPRGCRLQLQVNVSSSWKAFGPSAEHLRAKDVYADQRPLDACSVLRRTSANPVLRQL